MLESLRKAIAWFIEGLVDVLEEAGALRGRGAPLRLAAENGKLAVHRPGQAAVTGAFDLVADKDRPHLLPAESAAKLAGHDIDIVRPEAELIVRTLDPLPADSRPYLDGIVRHHVERLAPWRADDVLFSYRVAEAGARDDRLVVTLAATSRAFAAALIGALTALDAGRLRLLFSGAASAGEDIVIPVNVEALDRARRARRRRVVVAAVALLLLGGTGGGAFLAYQWHRASTEADAAQTSIAGLRKQLAARGPQHPGQGRDIEAILTKRRTMPYTVLAINDIAATLPDSTWLSELRVGDGHLRVTGISRNVAELVPLIEAVPGFTEARFYAPTTRMATGGDRFYLDMRIVPVDGKPR